MLCNEASIKLTDKKADKKYEFIGDQVDIALAQYTLGIDESILKIKDLSVLSEDESP